MSTPKKILVVDDDRAYSKVLSRLLIDEGFEVLTAEDGLHAEWLAVNELPDLILLDHHLPGADGLTVLGRLQRIASTRSIPVIYLTGSESKVLSGKALEGGALEVFRKGMMDEDYLRRLIAGVFGKAEPGEKQITPDGRPGCDNPPAPQPEKRDPWGPSE